MRRLTAVVLVLFAVFAFNQLDEITQQAKTESSSMDVHCVELLCCHNNNGDAEGPSSVVVPSVQTRTINGHRANSYRAPQILATDHFQITSNYVVARFVHRVSSFARASDFYLYTLCRLRL